VTNLEDGRMLQLALPLDRHSSDAIDAAVDEVRARFGTSAITRAVLVGRRTGFTVPLLAD
jgi:DNA polymerase-4